MQISSVINSSVLPILLLQYTHKGEILQWTIIIMKMKKEAVKTVSKKVAAVLDTVLKVEANSTSCGLIYQPKEPKKMDRFKRTNK